MIEQLIEALKTDKELYYAYQANIAIQFKDEFARNKKKYKSRQDIHEIANTVAKNFLNLLMKD